LLAHAVTIYIEPLKVGTTAAISRFCHAVLAARMQNGVGGPLKNRSWHYKSSKTKSIYVAIATVYIVQDLAFLTELF
jgi:hypothetical protein